MDLSQNLCVPSILHQIYPAGFLNSKTTELSVMSQMKDGRSTVLVVTYTCPKWWHATKQYVQYDTRCPHICFRPIMLEENLRSNIVWAANYISENLT